MDVKLPLIFWQAIRLGNHPSKFTKNVNGDNVFHAIRLLLVNMPSSSIFARA